MARPLWAPWRMAYILGPKPDGCVFCAARDGDDDRAHLVVARGDHVFTVLNRFPYAPGHLMVLPVRHVGAVEDLTPAEAADLWAGLVRAKTALDRVSAPHGYNVGLNLGAAAGAGVAEHLHLHVVPRWEGDNNFMPVLADTRVIPQHLDDQYERLVEALADG